MAEALDASVRQALFELQRYLSDLVAPLMVTDSVEVLLHYQPQLVAVEIQAWVARQYRGHAATVPVSDYLFHAVKKIHQMSEFKLIEPDRLKSYLEELAKIIVELCPFEDREMLKANFDRLGMVETDLTSPVEVIHRQMGSGTAPARLASSGSAAPPGMSEEAARGLRRIALLAQRLEHVPTAAGGSASVGGDGSASANAADGQPVPGGQPGAGTAASGSVQLQNELVTQILATAAISSRNGADFEQYMYRLGDLGIDARTDQMFRALSKTLPGWVVPVSAAGVSSSITPPPSPSLEAMRRIITLAEDPEEGAKRFNEMLQAAIEQFNTGSLSQAVSMFDLADRISSERRLDFEVVKSIRKRAHDRLSTEQLRQFAEKPEKHALLRKVLEFFPALTTQGLLADIDGEPRRDRRKLLLALLEVHGAPARAAALERIESYAAGAVSDNDGFYLRNLVYLLRRIPRPADVPADRELDVLIRLSRRGNHLIVLKEAIPALGMIKHEKAEQTLMMRLRDFEDMLLKSDSLYGTEDLRVLLDRTASALARLGTSHAARAVVNHAFSHQAQFGNAFARLAELAGVDLSSDRELVAHLVKALRDELPVKVLGFVVQKKNDVVMHLVQAISGTPAAPVRQVLEEIVQRFPDQEFAKAASKALAALGATTKPTESPAKTLTGDLELFGLPNLLQSLAESQVTGILTLLDNEGDTSGTVYLESGMIRGCQVGALQGEIAVYQLFEKPIPGTFVFKSRREGIPDKDSIGPLTEVLPLVLEAMRRHDEFRVARVLVPDSVSLKPTGAKPTRPPDEEDQAFLRAVWSKATSGATSAKCEEGVNADSYRVRRLLAHWVEEGALSAA